MPRVEAAFLHAAAVRDAAAAVHEPAAEFFEVMRKPRLLLSANAHA